MIPPERWKHLLLAISASLLLNACASDPAKIAAADNERCESYGFKPGTDAFAQCRMQADSQRRDHQEQRRRDVINSIPDTPIVAPRM